MSQVKRLVDRYEGHPWDQTPGWTTEEYLTDSHQSAEKYANEMVSQGWVIWIVSNDGAPGFVVYKKSK